MKRLNAKLWMIVAVCIILLHAIVPHHHHDDEGEAGFVFENELVCHCHHDDASDHHSNHPINHCRLQDVLARLVIGQKYDEAMLALQSAPVMDLWLGEMTVGLDSECLLTLWEDCHGEFAPPALPLDEVLPGSPLRAPPCC